jgi:aconitate hydratase
MLTQQNFNARFRKSFGRGPKRRAFYSLPALEAAGVGPVSRLPVSIRIVLEALLRHCDDERVTEEQVRALANWQPNARREAEIPFVVARVVLQDFTGVPLLADLAAMRDAAAKYGADPQAIEPRVPVDLVVDHSVTVDHYGTADSLDLNMKLEFSRNRERYQFLKWGTQAFQTFRVVPPGTGIVHQVNLEYLSPGVHRDGELLYPDTLVGTDSHTTMINGIGVVGWGVGGIEAEAGMLGQPVYFLTPDVIGVELAGRLREGVTATDLVLTITELLRKTGVVGAFVEFFGEGAASLSVTDRATIANMAPEYGATMGFFPVDAKTVAYLKQTGRSAEAVADFEAYFKAQQLFGMPQPGVIDYSRTLRLDLATVAPSLAGPRRPQDRIEIGKVKSTFARLHRAASAEGGYGKDAATLARRYPLAGGGTIGDGDVLIAAITSCTNTSNPSVMLAAGLLARKAVARGLKVKPRIKTSLAPGSRVVSDYLERAGLLASLQALGFHLAGYGCTTCIGNAGDLTPEINAAIAEHDLVGAAVLSGNRNFEARIHPNLRANFLASPPLVVAYAIAGSVNVDLMSEPLGTGSDGEPVWIGDVWPSGAEIEAALHHATDPAAYRRRYATPLETHPLWRDIAGDSGATYGWPNSTYIARPPFFDDFAADPNPPTTIRGARALAIFGDSVTTDHISPAGSIKAESPAGQWLLNHGVRKAEFNSFGARRGHHEVMIRGTFGNVRIKNLMLPPGPDGKPVEGGFTRLGPEGGATTIFEAAAHYRRVGIPTIVFAGTEYGTGSSRDWAAKGTQLLGVRAVVAQSFERIHRANLIGMGVLPLQFRDRDSVASLGIRGDETFAIEGVGESPSPRQTATLVVTGRDGSERRIALTLRIDTPIEVAYYRHGGILPYVLRQLLGIA